MDLGRRPPLECGTGRGSGVAAALEAVDGQPRRPSRRRARTTGPRARAHTSGKPQRRTTSGRSWRPITTPDSRMRARWGWSQPGLGGVRRRATLPADLAPDDPIETPHRPAGRAGPEERHPGSPPRDAGLHVLRRIGRLRLHDRHLRVLVPHPSGPASGLVALRAAAVAGARDAAHGLRPDRAGIGGARGGRSARRRRRRLDQSGVRVRPARRPRARHAPADGGDRPAGAGVAQVSGPRHPPRLLRAAVRHRGLHQPRRRAVPARAPRVQDAPAAPALHAAHPRAAAGRSTWAAAAPCSPT